MNLKGSPELQLVGSKLGGNENEEREMKFI